MDVDLRDTGGHGSGGDRVLDSSYNDEATTSTDHDSSNHQLSRLGGNAQLLARRQPVGFLLGRKRVEQLRYLRKTYWQSWAFSFDRSPTERPQPILVAGWALDRLLAGLG